MEATNDNNPRIQTYRYNSKLNNEFRINIPKIKILFRNEEFLVIDKPYDVKIDGDSSKRPTGCYCLALTKLSARLASVAFTKRTVKKSYLAIVRNWMKDDNYIVDQPIAEVPNNRYRMCLGRRHQLRLHCLYLKHPILGDYHYENLCENLCYTDTWRMMLHAHKLFIPLRNNNNDDEKEEKEVIDEIKSLDIESDDPFSNLVYDS
ncbi:16952_t:CDS:2 [Entrophospora sp. SA101]|nr:16952_t:CDS:2 [Entrophospora sp. SA101]